MKTKTKALLLALCAILLVVASVFGTLAYLTDTQTVENTFTVGQVHIKLDESDIDGQAIRDQANNYNLLPGQEYTKDPTVTVVKGSEEAYIRILVTVHNYSGVKAAFGDGFTLADLVKTDQNSGVNTHWIHYDADDVTNNSITYEYRYDNTVSAKDEDEDVKIPALFTSIKIPENFTNEKIAYLYYTTDQGGNLTPLSDPFKITVVAQAIQATGFDNADAAWIAFTAQHLNS